MLVMGGVNLVYYLSMFQCNFCYWYLVCSLKKLLWTHDSDSYICASIAPVIYAYPQILMVA